MSSEEASVSSSSPMSLSSTAAYPHLGPYSEAMKVSTRSPPTSLWVTRLVTFTWYAF